MANPATHADVSARWRTLTTAEQAQATVFLDDAWRLLKRKVANLETRLDEGEADLEENAVQVLAQAVIRKMKNPDGVRQESITIDDATRQRTLATQPEPGAIYFTEAELESVREVEDERGKAFSIQPWFDADESSSSSSS